MRQSDCKTNTKPRKMRDWAIHASTSQLIIGIRKVLSRARANYWLNEVRVSSSINLDKTCYHQRDIRTMLRHENNQNHKVKVMAMSHGSAVTGSVIASLFQSDLIRSKDDADHKVKMYYIMVNCDYQTICITDPTLTCANLRNYSCGLQARHCSLPYSQHLYTLSIQLASVTVNSSNS